MANERRICPSPACAEGDARCHGHVRLAQEEIGGLDRLHAGAANVGEGVERALRRADSSRR